MKILQIAPHYGGGVGTVVSGWVQNDKHNTHRTYSLELCRDKKVNSLFVQLDDLRDDMKGADIVLLHFWDHPTLKELFSRPLPDCRLVFWLHKNTLEAMTLPGMVYDRDIWVIKTSPVQGAGRCIWSTGKMDRFLAIQPKEHVGFNIGTVLSPKLRPNFLNLCEAIKKEIPEARFTLLGEHNPNRQYPEYYTFAGKVDDVAPYLAEMDVFFYPLRKDHFGTAEQALGEAMAAGVVPVVMNNPAERIIWEHTSSTIEDCVEEITWFYEHPEHRKMVAAEARYTATRLYDIDTMIRAWNTVFEDMMKESKEDA